MTFLDFWSTSSALYAPDEGLKDAGVEKGHISPATGSAPDFGTCCLKILVRSLFKYRVLFKFNGVLKYRY